MTRWEEILHYLNPYATAKTPASWDERTRDFVAWARVKRQHLIKEQGPVSYPVKRISAVVTAYLDEDRHPSLTPRDQLYAKEWQEYEADPDTVKFWLIGSATGISYADTETRVDDLTAAGMDLDEAVEQAAREQAELWDAWEAENGIDFRHGHPRFPKGSQDRRGRRMARNAACLAIMIAQGQEPLKDPAYIELDQEIAEYEAASGKSYDPEMVVEHELRNAILCGEVPRWRVDPKSGRLTVIDEAAAQASADMVAEPISEPSPREVLLKTLYGYAGETQHGDMHVTRWNQALAALGESTGERPMTLIEAQENLRRFNKARWQPVVDAIMETAPKPPPDVAQDPVAAQIQQTAIDNYAEAVDAGIIGAINAGDWTHVARIATEKAAG